MSIHAKTRVVMTGLCVLAVWPLMHAVVVRVTGLSPWEGFGWAMYSVPPRLIDVQVRLLGDGAPLRPAETRPQALTLLSARSDFIERRRALGKRAQPDRLARAVLEVFPKIDAIEIVVEQAGVERSSGMVVLERTDRYEYRREDEW